MSTERQQCKSWNMTTEKPQIPFQTREYVDICLFGIEALVGNSYKHWNYMNVNYGLEHPRRSQMNIFRIPRVHTPFYFPFLQIFMFPRRVQNDEKMCQST